MVYKCLQATAMTMTITVHEFHSTGLRNDSQKAAVQYFQNCLHGKRKQFFFCMCCSHVEMNLCFLVSLCPVCVCCLLISSIFHKSHFGLQNLRDNTKDRVQSLHLKLMSSNSFLQLHNMESSLQAG